MSFRAFLGILFGMLVVSPFRLHSFLFLVVGVTFSVLCRSFSLFMRNDFVCGSKLSDFDLIEYRFEVYSCSFSHTSFIWWIPEHGYKQKD